MLVGKSSMGDGVEGGAYGGVCHGADHEFKIIDFMVAMRLSFRGQRYTVMVAENDTVNYYSNQGAMMKYEV